MPEALLDQFRNHLYDVFQAGASNGPWLSDVLEKAVRVVGCLDALFHQPNAPDYAFKGGTSPSKVYGVIDRFSEDVDITVSTKDPRILGDDDPLDGTTSNTRRKALNDAARYTRTSATTTRRCKRRACSLRSRPSSTRSSIS